MVTLTPRQIASLMKQSPRKRIETVKKTVMPTHTTTTKSTSSSSGSSSSSSSKSSSSSGGGSSSPSIIQQVLAGPVGTSYVTPETPKEKTTPTTSVLLAKQAEQKRAQEEAQKKAEQEKIAEQQRQKLLQQQQQEKILKAQRTARMLRSRTLAIPKAITNIKVQPTKEVKRSASKSEYMQALHDKKQELRNIRAQLLKNFTRINPTKRYNVTLSTGETKEMTGLQYRKMIGPDINKIKKAETQADKLFKSVQATAKDWHPNTKVIKHIEPDGTVWFDVRFPYAGAEKYGSYVRDFGLDKQSPKGLATAVTTAFTAEDPFGAKSAYHALSGDKQAYIDTKVKSLHQTSKYTKEGLTGFGKLWISMPITQTALAYGAGAALGAGTSYLQVVAPKLATVAKVGMGAVAAPSLYTEGKKIYGHATKGQYGEIVGSLATLGPTAYAGYKGFKMGAPKGTTAGYRHKVKAWIKSDTDRAKFNSLFDAIDKSQKMPTGVKKEIVHLKELQMEHFKNNPEQVDALTKWILKNQGKYKIQIGGSGAQSLQIKEGRLPGDLDITVLRKTIPRPVLYKQYQVKETLPTKFRKYTGIGKPKYQIKIKKGTRIGWTRDVSPRVKAQLTKEIGIKDLSHKVDVHVRGKPGEYIRPGATFKPSKKIGKFKFMDVTEQAARKGTSWQDIEHKGRGKDIFDFLNIRKEQLLNAKSKGVDISKEWAQYQDLLKWAPKTMTGAEGKQALPKDILSAFYEKQPSKAPTLSTTRYQKFLWKHTTPPDYFQGPPYSPVLKTPYKPPTQPSAWQQAMKNLKPGWWEKYMGKGYTKTPKYQYTSKTLPSGKIEYTRVPVPKTDIPTNLYGYSGYTEAPIIPSYTAPFAIKSGYPTLASKSKVDTYPTTIKTEEVAPIPYSKKKIDDSYKKVSPPTYKPTYPAKKLYYPKQKVDIVYPGQPYKHEPITGKTGYKENYPKTKPYIYPYTPSYPVKPSEKYPTTQSYKPPYKTQSVYSKTKTRPRIMKTVYAKEEKKPSIEKYEKKKKPTEAIKYKERVWDVPDIGAIPLSRKVSKKPTFFSIVKR